MVPSNLLIAEPCSTSRIPQYADYPKVVMAGDGAYYDDNELTVLLDGAWRGTGVLKDVAGTRGGRISPAMWWWFATAVPVAGGDETFVATALAAVAAIPGTDVYRNTTLEVSL